MEFSLDTQHQVSIASGEANLKGLLHIPTDATGIVLFVHGSGSSHLSPRNQHVASILQKNKLATLLFDLLTSDEEVIDRTTSQYRFDIGFLADRLDAATHWVLNDPAIKDLPIGYFGASTGAGAALVDAARFAHHVRAVVSRGGRPDLAGESLAHVKAPTLLIVGSLDHQVIDLNKNAMSHMQCVTKLELIKDATHLFEEPGTLEEVAIYAKSWFVKYLK